MRNNKKGVYFIHTIHQYQREIPMKKRFLMLQKKLFVFFVIFIFTFLPIAPALTGAQSASAQNNFNNTPNFNQWTRTPGNLNTIATPGGTTTVPGTSAQTQWTTQPDFNQGTNANTSNITSPGDVVLTPGTSAGDVIDTTVPDFNAGNTNPNNNITTSTTVSAPGDVSLAIEPPSSNTIYTPPPCTGECTNNLRASALDTTNHLIYNGTRSQLTATDTNNTPINTADDTTTTYTNLLLPHPIAPIANDYANGTTIDSVNHLLYISTQNGLSVIDTHGTTAPEDDTVFMTYNTTSTPAIASNMVNGVTLDTTNHLLYIGTDTGLSVIDTHNTLTPADDTLVTTYNSTGSVPAIAGNTVINTKIDSANHLLYIDTGSTGLSVIDTNNTITPSDDVLVGTDNVYREDVIGKVLAVDETTGVVYIQAATGLTAIDTKNNSDPSDDVVLITYTAPAWLGSYWVTHVSIDTARHLLYISTGAASGAYLGSLTVINTQGTVNPLDDLQVGLYRAANGLNLNDVTGTELDATNTVVYVTQNHSSGFWSAIHTQGTITQSDDVIENSPIGSQITTVTPDNTNDLIYITSTAGGVTVMNRQGTETITDDTIVGSYTTGTPAALPSNTVYGITSNPSTNTIYINTLNEITAIDTKGTVTDTTDDTVLTTYTGFNALKIDTVHHLLYLDSGSSIVVIDTNNTTTLSDDTTLMTYDTTSTPAILDSLSGSSVLDTTHHLLYVNTLGGVISIINTNNTVTPSDDTSTLAYSALNTIIDINQTTIDEAHNTVYISTAAGLYTIDTQGTASSLDDMMISIYDSVSTPSITPSGDNFIHSTALDTANNLVYINTQSDGLVVLNTQGTITSSDDTIVATYSWTSTPSITSNNITSTTIDTTNHLLYLSNYWDGVTIIDTQGTLTPADDTVITKYNYDSNPLYIDGNYVTSTTLDIANHLIYINTERGVSVIDTQNTNTAVDNTRVTAYTALRYLNPSNITDIIINETDHLLYISTEAEGVLVLDTHNNVNPTDDTILTQYSWRDTVLPIPSYDVRNIDFDSINHLLYINTSSDLTVIDTQGTATPTDDVISATYNTTNAPVLPSAWISFINSSTVDIVHNLLYISSAVGLIVIDTNGTATQSDDTIITTYDTLSTPSIASNTALSTSIDTVNNLLYVSTLEGLSVINTQGTVTASDDTLLTVYNYSSTPSIGQSWSSYVQGTLLDTVNHLVYVNTYYAGLSIINTQGTIDPIDDTVITYNTGSNPLNLPNNTVNQSFFNTPNLSQIYVVTNRGLVLLNTIGGNFNPSGTYFSSVRPIAATPTEALSFNATQTTDHATSLSYRAGVIGGDVVNNFDDNSTSEFAMNPYTWDDYFQTAVESGGTMKISNPVPWVDGINSAVDTSINTGQSFAAGSTITARIRINSNTRIAQDWTDSLFTDSWSDSNSPGFLPNNTWQTVTLTSTMSFSIVGFDITYQTGSWDNANDSLEIDSLTITPGPNLSETIVPNTFANSGMPQGWHDDDASWAYTLPFDFTFFGVTYAAGQTIQISSNGIICLNNTLNCGSVYGNNIGSTIDGPIIAPLNMDLLTSTNPGDDIYLTEDPNFVTFRWQATDLMDGNPVNFEATLFKNGNIKFNYGDQLLAPFSGSAMVGINSGDGINYSGSVYNNWNAFHQLDSSFWSIPIAWNTWSVPCAASPCTINPADLVGKTIIQYKLALTSSNPLTTPVVHDVTYSSKYARTGTYTSQNITFPAGNKLASFAADITTPSNTSLTFEYSIDGGTTWTSLSSSYTFPSNFIATQFQWRATFTSSSILNIPNIHGVTLSTLSVDTTTTLPAINPPDRVSKVTLDQKKLKTGNDINYTETCAPLLEGKYTDAKNGEVFLYQMRDAGGKDKIKNDSIDSKGIFSLRIPTIDMMQTYYLRLTNSNGDESALSKPFIISCAQPMPPYTPPLEESSEIMLPHIRPEGPPAILMQDESTTSIAASIVPNEPNNPSSFLSILLSIGGILAGTALFGGLLAFLPLFSAIPSALQGSLFSVLPISTLFTSRKGRKNWGTVFDAQTKQAIPNVRLSLVNERGSVLDTINTDQYGRYGLLTTPGVYTITINKGEYKLQTTQATDSVYGDIYHGQKMTISSMGEIVALNIALDPGSVDWKAFAQSMVTRSASLTRSIILDLFYILYSGGGIFTLVMAYKHKDMLNISLAILYICLFGWFIHQSMIKGKSFGTLKDKKTSTPIAFAQVALHTIIDPHRAAFAVTDPIGRYYLLADNGRYHVKVGGQFENRVFNEETPIQVNDGTLRTDFIV